jgi:hypothetical protein
MTMLSVPSQEMMRGRERSARSRMSPMGRARAMGMRKGGGGVAMGNGGESGAGLLTGTARDTAGVDTGGTGIGGSCSLMAALSRREAAFPSQFADKRPAVNIGGMKLPKPVDLLHGPSAKVADAHIVKLTNRLIRERMGEAWWREDSIDSELAESEIDRHWDWIKMTIERDGVNLRSIRLGIVTSDSAVQGAIMLSAEPVPCEGEPSRSALFVELLFSAPRNRKWLRRDQTELFRGVGIQLLRTAAELSLEAGLGGRLKLEASPASLEWYRNRGLIVVSPERIVYEGVKYTPMELEAKRASLLLLAQ